MFHIIRCLGFLCGISIFVLQRYIFYFKEKQPFSLFNIQAFGINAYGLKGKLLIQTNVNEEDVNITVTNAAGAVVAEDTMSGHGSKNYILPAGMYIVNKVRKVFVR